MRWFFPLLTLAIAAHAIEPGIAPEAPRGEGPAGLIRAVLSADAVVEAKLLPHGAFEIVRTFRGPLAAGAKLPFSQCQRIEPRYDPEETLQRIAHLSVGSRPPAPSARFLLLVTLNKDKTWAFPQRAAGDLYLIERGKVYQVTEDQDDPKKPQLWTAFSWMREEPSFLQEVSHQLRRRDELEQALRDGDAHRRVERLKPYLDPRIERDPMVLRAVAALSEAGPEGLDALIGVADRPGMEPFVPVFMRKCGEKKYSGALSWLRRRCREANSRLNENEIPFDSSNAVLEDARSFAELQACVRALGDLGASDAAPEVRDAGAWFLSHKADWWATTFRSPAEAEPIFALMRSGGASGNALASQAQAISRSGDWPGSDKIEAWSAEFSKAYGRDAAPFLIWAWRKGSDKARASLVALGPAALGDDPVAWWQWYWKSSLHPADR